LQYANSLGFQSRLEDSEAQEPGPSGPANGKAAGSPRFGVSSRQARLNLNARKLPKKEEVMASAKPSKKVDYDDEGGLTSSEEEEEDEGDDDDDARTTTADDDGLDHLTESVGEPFGLQLDATPGQSPVLETHAPNHNPPSFEAPMPTMSKLPGGFGDEFADQPLSASPRLVPSADNGLLEDVMTMPAEVLDLNPVICDACFAPMPLAKWTEHISKIAHRRNAAQYSQMVFKQTTTDWDPPSPTDNQSTSRKDPALDTRERWVEATRIRPRQARPGEYAFCDICAVFLVRGDVEHFQGKKHLRCVRAAALNDADELESVRGSVSDEEDGPAARAFRAAAAALPHVKPETRARPTGRLGQQAFQRTGASPEQQESGHMQPSDQLLIPQLVDINDAWDM
jgi:hypothetical protein